MSTATTMSDHHRHRALYKSAIDPAETAAQRRRQFLDLQKAQRQTANDHLRSLVQGIVDDQQQQQEPTSATDDEKISNISAAGHNRHNRRPKPRYKDLLQLSEWLRKRPDDFHLWTMVLCPRGRRVLLVATGGRTKVYGKRGEYVRYFRSALPGDTSSTRNALTIFDAIQTADHGYYVLDVLTYGHQVFGDCDAEFRFFWLQSTVSSELRAMELERQVAGDANDQRHNRIRLAERVDCADHEECAALMDAGPRPHDPPLDGLLFYHRESLYVNGSTPLVGWLYPFMCAEVLGDEWRTVRTDAWAEQPADYGGAEAFMDRFDAELAASRKRGGNTGRRGKRWAEREERMAVEDGGGGEAQEDVDAMDVMAEQRELELVGDDEYFEE